MTYVCLCVYARPLPCAQVLADLVSEARHMDEHGWDVTALVQTGIDGILEVFALQRIRRNDFCRLFLRLGLLPSITVCALSVDTCAHTVAAPRAMMKR
jgi:hypothetical protein